MSHRKLSGGAPGRPRPSCTSGGPLLSVSMGCRALAIAAAHSAPPTQHVGADLRAPLTNVSATREHARLRRADHGVLVTANDILFETASTDLSSATRSNLDELIDYLAKHVEWAVLLEGHTDNAGSDVLNFSLSRRRAAAVQAYVVEQGIEPSRVQTEGVGESDPVVSNATAAGRRENRRVAVVFEAMSRR